MIEKAPTHVPRMWLALGLVVVLGAALGAAAQALAKPAPTAASVG